MDLYLIRHTAVCVPAGYAYGQTDVGLLNSFEQEAEVVRQQLLDIPFDKVWSSPLSRCVKLADYCGFHDAAQDARLKEMHFGAWEMKSWDEIAADPQSKPWFADWLHYPTPGGESFMDQYKRVATFLRFVKEQELKQVGLFAHAGVLACARVYANACEMKDAFKQIPAFGEVIHLSL